MKDRDLNCHLCTSPEEFVEDFVRWLEADPVAVYLQLMHWDMSKGSGKLLKEAMARVAGRGVEVNIGLDGLSLFWSPEGPWVENIFRLGKVLGYYRAQEKAIEELRRAGVRLRITHPVRFPWQVFPVVGRDHTKLGVIETRHGGIVYVGSVALVDRGWVDPMLRLEDDISLVAAAKLAMMRGISDRPDKNYYWAGEGWKVVVDGVKDGQSLIAKELARLIDKAATSVYMVTPWMVDGKVRESMDRAWGRGVKVVHVRGFGPEVGRLLGFLMGLEQGVFGGGVPVWSWRSRQICHAKIAVVDGVLVIGSYNVVGGGRILAQETNFFIENPNLAGMMRDWIEGLVVGC